MSLVSLKTVVVVFVDWSYSNIQSASFEIPVAVVKKYNLLFASSDIEPIQILLGIPPPSPVIPLIAPRTPSPLFPALLI